MKMSGMGTIERQVYAAAFVAAKQERERLSGLALDTPTREALARYADERAEDAVRLYQLSRAQQSMKEVLMKGESR